jgi:hypothetical protein
MHIYINQHFASRRAKQSSSMEKLTDFALGQHSIAMEHTILPTDFPEVPSSSRVNFPVHHLRQPTLTAPFTMAHQPNANANFPLPPYTSAFATNMVVDSDLPFTTLKKGKQKGATSPSSHSIPSFFQRRPLPLSPKTVATAAGTNHPDAPPTKKGYQQVPQQMRTKIQRTQPLLYSLHQNPTFLPHGSGLIFQCPLPAHHSTLIQTFFSLFRNSFLQHGKLTLSFLSFQHPWPQSIPH